MDKITFKQMLQKKIVLLDGATGTELQKKNMPQAVCPEQWVLRHPNILKEIQQAYMNAGSDIILTCTFGCNRIKLEEFGFQDLVLPWNRKLAKLSREAAGPNCLIAGDLAPTGKFVEPFGTMKFDDLVAIYQEQVQGLLEGGVDLFFVETMLDLQEVRAALLAIKETCDLPIITSMTFDTDARTLTGSDPVTVLVTLQSLGANAVGANCSTGPEDMLRVIETMAPYAKVPLMVKPNAGLPKLINGRTVFDMGPEQFGKYALDFAQAGVGLFGGCCGTTPEHIKNAKEHLLKQQPTPTVHTTAPYSALTSARKTVFLGATQPLTIVGERINPTGKKKLSAELREGKYTEVRRLAAEQLENGAQVLDVNVGMPGIDEKKTMVEAIKILSNAVDCPLCLDSSSPDVLEAALRIYPGRALINSISAEDKKIRRLLPIVRKYGAMFILLPLSDAGVPEQAEERYAIIEKIITAAAKHGFENNDIVVDGLVMSVSSNQEAARETLKVIKWCTETAGCATLVGLSNISFGLPERAYLNVAFLAMGVGQGLSMAIANPSSAMIMDIKAACDVLSNKDKNSSAYIGRYSTKEKVPLEQAAPPTTLSTLDQISQSVLDGDKENASNLIQKALAEDANPADIIDNYLIPAITQVGDFYEAKKYFLPQLIQSAETMQAAFDILAPLLGKTEGENGKTPPVVLIATVKGDIHDIGKNIVGLMLRNSGFTVHDLGKNVSAERIIQEAKQTKAQLIGLSALLTTTMVEMKTVLELARNQLPNVKLMIGGAVVNERYAKEIGAHGYAKDAYEAVKLAQRLTGLTKS